MSMKNTVKNKEELLILFKIFDKVKESGHTEVGMESKLRSYFLEFIYDSLGEKFVKNNRFHALNRQQFDVLIELLFLKFGNAEFYNSFDFEKHEKLSKIERVYNRYIKNRNGIIKKIDNLKYTKANLETSLEDLDGNWLNTNN